MKRNNRYTFLHEIILYESILQDLIILMLVKAYSIGKIYKLIYNTGIHGNIEYTL